MCQNFVLHFVSQVLVLCLSQSPLFHRMTLEVACALKSTYSSSVLIILIRAVFKSLISSSPENDLPIYVTTPSSSSFQRDISFKVVSKSFRIVILGLFHCTIASDCLTYTCFQGYNIRCHKDIMSISM